MQPRLQRLLRTEQAGAQLVAYLSNQRWWPLLAGRCGTGERGVCSPKQQAAGSHGP